MNNKGQTLVIFIIILPIILLLFALVVDLGLLYIDKKNIDTNTYDAVEYYLENIDKENVEDNTIKLLKNNLNDIEININETDFYIEISVKKIKKGLFTGILNNEEINITYKGIKSNKEIIKG